jgi:hypothetical protein
MEKNTKNKRGRYWFDHNQFSDWVSMLGGVQNVSERLGLSIGTIERYCTGQTRIPKAIYAFLELLATGQLAPVLGQEWNDIRLTPHGIHLPGWRRPFSSQELHSLFVMLSGKRIVENQLQLTKKWLQETQAAAEEWERRALFYRQQLILESKMGLMLARVAST